MLQPVTSNMVAAQMAMNMIRVAQQQKDVESQGYWSAIRRLLENRVKEERWKQ